MSKNKKHHFTFYIKLDCYIQVFYTMLTHFRINYSTNLTYFPIFLHLVDFSKVVTVTLLAAAATVVAAAAAAQLAAEP